MNSIQIKISIGEAIDRLTILQIKNFALDNENLENEIQELKMSLSVLPFSLDSYVIELREINEKLWKVEDKLRVLENNKTFDSTFIELARSVYKLNDERHRIKKEVNEKFHSNYGELKIYSK